MIALNVAVSAWRPATDFNGVSELLEFFETYYAPAKLTLAADSTRDTFRLAIRHFAKFLSRVPLIGDLDASALAALQTHLKQRVTTSHANEICAKLIHLSNDAQQCGILADRIDGFPSPDKRSTSSLERAAWNAIELNQLICASKSMSGSIAGLPANHWWPALILSLLDTVATVPTLLKVSTDAFERRAGTVRIGCYCHTLHPITFDALTLLGTNARARLFPWERDGGRPPFHMLYRDYKKLLWRAGLPHSQNNLFQKLRTTARLDGVLERINPEFCFAPRLGQPCFPRLRDRVREEGKSTALQLRAPLKQKELKMYTPSDGIYRINHDSVRKLMTFFDNVYKPLRLCGSAQKTLLHYRASINKFSDYLACEATLDNLSDAAIEGFSCWSLLSRRWAVVSINNCTADLIALWRYAWRKKLTETLPRDIDKLRENKTLPCAWSIDELGRILRACEAQEGNWSGISAKLYWPALILFVYDTGLRIGAVKALKAVQLNMLTGTVHVPAAIQKQRADQVFRIHPDTVAAIAATNPEGREYLFPYSFTCNKPLTHAYRQIVFQAGLPAGSRDLFHKLRRTSATHLANAMSEEAARKHLGHSDPATTRRYIDPSKLDQPSAADLLPRPKWKEQDGN